MARHDDASSYADLLARLGDDGTKELFRHLLEHALQDLIDAELTSRMGASRHERSDARSKLSQRCPHRTLSTPAGDVELRIPKVRVVACNWLIIVVIVAPCGGDEAGVTGRF
jgi:transposase-like protein